MPDLRLRSLRFRADGGKVAIWTSTLGGLWGIGPLTHAEVVRLHAWLAGWLAEHQPESEMA